MAETDDKAGVQFFNGPGWWEAAGQSWQKMNQQGNYHDPN